MSLWRLLVLRSLRRPPAVQPISVTVRSFAFSSAEEAAAERRRRKRRLRIEPPLNAIRPPLQHSPSRDPNAPRLPDSTSALVGPRLNLHNRVQSLIRAGDLDAASSVARHSTFSSTRPTVFTCNAIIAAMYRAKRYNEAIALFHFFFTQSNIVPNIVSYNNVINTHCDEGRVDVALELYRHIIATAPFGPSAVTYRHLTKGFISAGRIVEALDLLREMLNKGHGADSLVYNNLISGFLELGNLDKANELFDELKERCLVYDGVVNATYMEWFFNNGRDKEAMDSYKSLMDRQFKMTPVTCNVLLEVLLKHGKKTQAWALFDQMLDNHTPPNFQAVNSDTFNIMVNECFNLGKFHEALATFRKAGTKSNSKAFAMDVAGYNNIISRFCENGLLSEAETLFEELCSKSLSPDVPTHRTLIDAYMKMERIDDALKVFHRMVDAGLRVVTNFCNRVFDELIKNDKVIDCAHILSKMGERDPKPDPTCYEVVIRGLCAKGLLDKSLELLYQVMRYGVGVTNSLREFVTEVFKKAGRGDEIERLLDFNTPRYRPPQLTRQPYPTSGSPPQQMQPPSLPSVQMAGVHNPSPGFMPQVAAQEHPPLPPQNTGMHQPSWGVSPPMTGPQMPAAGPSPHTSGLPYSPPSEFQTHMKGVAPQMSANHYTPSAPSPQMAGHQPYGTPSGPQQYPPSGLTPPWGGQHHPQSWSSIPSHGTSAKMSALCNTAPGPSSQMTGPYNPASGIPPHIQEPHQQQSEVPEQGFVLPDLKNRFFLWSFLIVVSLICGAYVVGNASFAKEYKQRLARWGLIYSLPVTKSNACKKHCWPSGTEALPKGIVARTSSFEMRPLWDSGINHRISKHPLNLLAIAVGIKQKEIVNKIVEKFPSSDFVVMLFHYDGFVDGWKNLAWSKHAIHVSAINQTKWWFAKRFLHPDIVADYNYIFLWDEDLLIDNFDPKRYVSIVKEEGLEISQPALDPVKSEVHHPLTVRKAGSKVHRRYYKFKGGGRCDDNSTAPPCTGWVEMMAPVFSRKSWQCVWHLIQNDLIHAWGLDRQLGYCALGNRMKNVGVVDSEYIVHLGLPTLGSSNDNETLSDSHKDNSRVKVRMQSYIEMQVFGKRWKEAANKDKCWSDPYGQVANQTSHY